MRKAWSVALFLALLTLFPSAGARAQMLAERAYEDLIWPCSGVVVQEYGVPYGNAIHQGIDITGLTNAPLKSMGSGVVTRVFKNGWYGNAVVIKLDNHGLELLYAHLADFQGDNGATRPGQRVRAGFVIGRMGTTGTSNGIHLHLEMRRDGELINPRDVLNFIPKPIAEEGGLSPALPAPIGLEEFRRLDLESDLESVGELDALLERVAVSSEYVRAGFERKLRFRDAHDPFCNRLPGRHSR